MKHKVSSTNLSKQIDKPLSEWDRLIEAGKQRVKELKLSIRTWEGLRDAGEPWPGTKDAESVDAAERASG
jgi:hypothetical protein